jgi:hypothetical protein
MVPKGFTVFVFGIPMTIEQLVSYVPCTVIVRITHVLIVIIEKKIILIDLNLNIMPQFLLALS